MITLISVVNVYFVCVGRCVRAYAADEVNRLSSSPWVIPLLFSFQDTIS